MRKLLGVGMVLALACGTAIAEEKIDAKKLIGKWEKKDSGKDKLVVEFTKDGKLSFVGKIGDQEIKGEGTYKLDGNKLEVTAKIGDDTVKMTRTISKLTDTELTSKDDDSGMEDTMVRVKEKKDK
jgi:uncharacterized protein (TIGR03066 family)